MDGEHGSIARIVCDEIAFPLESFFASHATQSIDRRVPPRAPNGEQMRFFVESFRRQLAERGVVIEHIESSAKGCSYQIVFSLLDCQVADGDIGKPVRALEPFLPSIHRCKYAELGPEEKQIGLHVVLFDAPHQMAFGQTGSDGRPSLAAVSALDHVRFIVSALMVI